MENISLLSKIKRIFIGGKRDLKDPTTFHKISLIAFFAWVGLGSDGLSSSCYGPSEVMLALAGHPNLIFIIGIASVFTIIVLSTSYSQIIELFPQGGGGYLVASKLLSPNVGMVAGAALLIDYVLTITVSIASGADALFSFLPKEIYDLRLWVASLAIILLTILNMRGAKESVQMLVPIFLVFILTHVFAIFYSLIINSYNFPTVIADTSTDFSMTISQLGTLGTLFLIMHAYSMGAGTYTGIEAVSDSIMILREPRVLTAKRTMKYMAISLSITVLGLMIAYLLFGVRHEQGKTLNAVLFSALSASWHPTLSYTFIIITLVSEAAILFVAAQTGFLDGPRVLSNMAIDRWVPTRFASLSDRLVTQNGIILMGSASLVLMIMTKGQVGFLLVLYSINVFITFSLSQLGMVLHWWRTRKEEPKWFKKLLVNGIGLLLTSFILFMVIIVKFNEGGWITILITGALISIIVLIKKHYNDAGKLIKKVDSLVTALEAVNGNLGHSDPDRKAEYERYGRTAVLLVSNYSGLGLHSLLSVFKMFGDSVKNFVFIQAGVVDARVFRKTGNLEEIEKNMIGELEKYTDLMKTNGIYSEYFYGMGNDVVETVENLLPKILERFPNSYFFGGQLVFKHETFLTRWLHNYTVFAVQRKLYHQGINFVILPIKV
ncbi:MAG: putative rane protein [Ignavibacteria bacterium]|nr:putative rane protein [Ignavibacteria bacterium]